MNTVLKVLLAIIIPGLGWIAYRVFQRAFEDITQFQAAIYFLSAVALLMAAANLLSTFFDKGE